MRPRHRLHHWLSLTLTALALAGCGLIGPTPTVTPAPTMTPRGAPPPTVPVTPYAEGLTVRMTAEGFDPPALAVVVHSTVTWTNAGTGAHHLRQGAPDAAAGFDSGALAPGATFAFTFEAAGDYLYFCALHPEQRGLIHVVP